MGSRIILVRLPKIIPNIARLALPSALIIDENILLIIRKGIPNATISKYCFTYSIVAGVAPTSFATGSIKMMIARRPIIPIAVPVQKQNAHACFASSLLFSPSILDIRDVPPIPKSIPIAIKKRKAGVPSDTAATMYAFFV